MNSTNHFKNTIKAYLDRRAADDELFAVSYAKDGKNIDDCISYILGTVQKSGCNGFADSEIYSMAVHYYDEDNIKVGKLPDRFRAVVNHAAELTEEEKNEARKAAIAKAQDEAYAAYTKKTPKPKKKEENVEQPSLFD